MLAMLLLEKWDCQTCTKAQKGSRGCDTDAAIPMRFDGEELRRCPRRPLLDDPEGVTSVITRYRAYMKGFLPDSGQFDDQAYRFTVLVQIVEQAVDDAKAELERRASTK